MERGQQQSLGRPREARMVCVSSQENDGEEGSEDSPPGETQTSLCSLKPSRKASRRMR